jgi:hypothetical protein
MHGETPVAVDPHQTEPPGLVGREGETDLIGDEPVPPGRASRRCARRSIAAGSRKKVRARQRRRARCSMTCAPGAGGDPGPCKSSGVNPPAVAVAGTVAARNSAGMGTAASALGRKTCEGTKTAGLTAKRMTVNYGLSRQG